MKKVLKIILIILIILILLLISFRVFNYIWAKNIYSKILENEGKDYYAEVINNDKINNRVMEEKYINNDNYLKRELTNISSDGIKMTYSAIIDKDKNMEIINYSGDYVQNQSDVVNINFDRTLYSYSVFNSFKIYDLIEKEKNSVFDKIKYEFFNLINNTPTLIKTEEYEGKNCYAMTTYYGNDLVQKLYVEKETYLPVASFLGNENSTTYNITLREIANEEFDYPDLSNYYVKVY